MAKTVAFSDKRIEDVDAKELKNIQGFAKSMAIRKGRGHLADDFSSFVLEYLVRKGVVVYNLHWLWSDFTRNEVGSPRTRKGKIQRFQSNSPVALEDAMFVKDESPQPDEVLHQKGIFRHYKLQSRVVAVLIAKWGFTGEEIAEVLGVTPARVGQIAMKMRAEGYNGNFTGSKNAKTQADIEKCMGEATKRAIENFGAGGQEVKPSTVESRRTKITKA